MQFLALHGKVYHALLIHDNQSSKVPENTPLEWKTLSRKHVVLCNIIHRAAQARSRLQTILRAFKQPVLEVVQDVPTRWNSEYAMLERLCTLKNSITAERASAQISIKKLQDSEWDLLEGYVEVLAPFEEATKEISK
ncbi:hypothetical protein PR048_001509 [Dryococelus australis]|uniref:Zinc finger BED domain-containing protein 4 n=1 Tax=Dryococelus australis TaxID=614101 RepID=A0ABQ9IIK6_9NEOP|nr:hypothetical protein PR048_001509 [Dryococelus australis]